MPRKTGQHKRQGAPRLLRNDFLAANYAAQVAGRLRKDGWEGSDTEIFWRFAEKVDPTGREKDKPFRYLKWACGRYLETFKDGGRGILAEDLYKIREDLELFEDKKKRGLLKDGKADIQRYTVRTLADFTTELRGGALDGFDDMLAKAPGPVMNATTILYRGPEGIALTPHSREAAIHWSRGTRWCTGAENGDNMFFYYNIDGPLVILFTATKERYQGHATSPVMDAQDREAASSPALDALLHRIDSRLVKRNPQDDKTWNDRDFVLRRVRYNGLDLRYASQDLQADREIVLEAVQQSGESLQYAAENLRADKNIVLDAVKQNGDALQYAAENLRADKDVVLKAVRWRGRALQYAAESLRADKDIVLDAVRDNGWALQYAAKHLQANKGVVLDAVRQSGWALQYAARRLRADKNVVLDAVRESGEALRYAAERLRADKDVVLDAVRQNGMALQYAAENLRTDREVVLAALRQDPDAFEYAAPALREDRAFLAEALRAVPELADTLPHEAWIKIAPATRRQHFADRLRKDWRNIAYADDCGVALSLETQRKAFTRARQEDPDDLKKALHLFPALREEWKKGALTLDRAGTLLRPQPRRRAAPEKTRSKPA